MTVEGGNKNFNRNILSCKIVAPTPYYLHRETCGNMLQDSLDYYSAACLCL